MYRVLAARSLKFLEQRQEDTASYQSQVRDPSRDGKKYPAVDGILTTAGGDEDYHSRVKETAAGGPFHVHYPDKFSQSHGSYARQVGERYEKPAPLLGHPPKPSMANSHTHQATPPINNFDGTQQQQQTKQHAHIIVHEKKDKSDQMNLRIQTSMERQKLQTYILVDDVIQKRLKKKKRKDLNISASLASLNGKKLSREHLSSAVKDASLGVGVWSTLGQDYHEQGTPDVDLPELNWGVSVRDLTRSKQSRPAPLKEASDHRKKYENLIELFRNQRHRVMKSRPRDGQDGIPRPSTGHATIGGSSSLIAAMMPNSSVEVSGLISDVSIADENPQNPANQSLLARLYQTQSQGRFASSKEEKEDHAGDPSSTEPLKRSQSAALLGRSAGPSSSSSSSSSSSTATTKHLEANQTSVERIAALQPRKMGWNPSDVRPLASSASQPNFDRRSTTMSGPLASGHAQKLSYGLSLTSLPENHPAQTHVGILPQQNPPSLNKLATDQTEREMKEAKNAAIGIRLGKSLSLTDLDSSKKGSRLSSPTRVKFSTSRSKSGLVYGHGVILAPGHPDYLARKQESYLAAKERAKKKKLKEEQEKQVYEAVMKQLAESRLDHLHRWRNAFDGTKQRLDRLLIKRLVTRAEERAVALDGGVTTLGPIVESVLTEQELAEATADPTHQARLATTAKHRKTRSFGRDSILQDDFTQPVYEDHLGIPPVSSPIAEGEEDVSSTAGTHRSSSSSTHRSVRNASLSKKHHPKSYSIHDLAARQDEAQREYEAGVAADPSILPEHFYPNRQQYESKITNKPGSQQQTNQANVNLSTTQ